MGKVWFKRSFIYKNLKGIFKILDLAFLSKGMLRLPICFVRKLHFNCCLKIRHFIRLWWYFNLETDSWCLKLYLTLFNLNKTIMFIMRFYLLCNFILFFFIYHFISYTFFLCIFISQNLFTISFWEIHINDMIMQHQCQNCLLLSFLSLLRHMNEEQFNILLQPLILIPIIQYLVFKWLENMKHSWYHWLLPLLACWLWFAIIIFYVNLSAFCVMH